MDINTWVAIKAAECNSALAEYQAAAVAVEAASIMLEAAQRSLAEAIAERDAK